MGMHKTLNIHIFVMECATDIIPVSFYSLRIWLSFDTKHSMFIYYKNSYKVKHGGFESQMTSRGNKRLNLRWLLSENDIYSTYIQTMY